jgi:lipopolysaccharide biosynthesis protein
MPDSVGELPRSRWRRRKLDVVSFADRARDARQWRLAAQLYREALDRDSRNAPIWVQYGHALKESGELRDLEMLAQAELAYRHSLSLDPRVADSYLQLGHILKLRGKTEEAEAAYLRAVALDSVMPYPLDELLGLGWSSLQLSELRALLGKDTSAVLGRWGEKQLTVHRPPVSSSSVSVDSAIYTGGRPLDPAEREIAELISRSGLFDTAWYLEENNDLPGSVDDPLLHYLRRGAFEGRDPHPLFDSDWYLASNPDVAKSGTNPLVHYLCNGATEERDPHPLFDSDWYLATNPDVAKAGINPLVHYLRCGAMKGRAPHPRFDTAWYLKTNPDVAANGLNPLVHYLLRGRLEGRAPHPQFCDVSSLENKSEIADKGSGPPADQIASTSAAPTAARRRVHAPDLFELRGLKPRGRIAVVLHLFDASLWGEMQQAIERISHPFDLFVSVVQGFSEHMSAEITQAFPNAYVFVFEDHGRDIGAFLVFLQSGVLFRYDFICKLHTKRSPHRQDGDGWRQWLIKGVLGSSDLVDQIVSNFQSNPDLGIVVADGNIYRGHEHWISNEKRLSELLPRIGISPDVRDRSFPGGSIFWIRSFLLRTLAGANISIDDFEPEPLRNDGSLGHAIERMFGLICEDAGMQVIEHSRLAPITQPPAPSSWKVNIVAFYLPQYHPVPENNNWWGAGFTEWTNVSTAKPLFPNHRQPRLPGDLGFYDLRLPEIREAQAELGRRYGVTAFCYYYYWFNGRRILERPLDEVLTTAKPDFPFLICWANEPWTRNWDGLSQNVLLPQAYELGWTRRFARDIAPLLHDARYFRLDGKPMLLIYRIGHIPEPERSIRELRLALSQEGISELHIGAAWVWFPEDDELPINPSNLGLDSYFEFPPHMCPNQVFQPNPARPFNELSGKIYDYNRTVTAAIMKLGAPTEGELHRGVMAGWDNTARRGAAAHIFHGATPTSFRRWLRATVAHERQHGGERVVFIVAWNEWAEGTYLEPDRDFGCGWLEAVASATDVDSQKIVL